MASGKSKVHVLDLAKGEFRFQKPENILTRRDYYRQKHAPDDKDEFCFEKMMDTHFESQLKRIISILIRGGHGMSADELISFILFLELQRLKVPAQAAFAKELMRHTVEKAALSIPEIAEGIEKNWYQLEIKDEYRFTFMYEMLKEQLYFWYFTRMIWSVWTMPADVHLVTTDNPVTIFNPNYPYLKHPGIGRLGSVVLFPLTPKYCLEMIHPEREHEPNFNPDAIVEVQPGDGHIQIRAGQVMPEDKATAVNTILTTRADRFVVSDDKPTLDELWSSLQHT